MRKFVHELREKFFVRPARYPVEVDAATTDAGVFLRDDATAAENRRAFGQGFVDGADGLHAAGEDFEADVLRCSMAAYCLGEEKKAVKAALLGVDEGLPRAGVGGWFRKVPGVNDVLGKEPATGEVREEGVVVGLDAGPDCEFVAGKRGVRGAGDDEGDALAGGFETLAELLAQGVGVGEEEAARQVC